MTSTDACARPMLHTSTFVSASALPTWSRRDAPLVPIRPELTPASSSLPHLHAICRFAFLRFATLAATRSALSDVFINGRRASENLKRGEGTLSRTYRRDFAREGARGAS
jgi:hypothetical protein